MKAMKKEAVHYTHNDLIGATNPVTVNLIGAGGTGSNVLTALMKMNHSMLALNHAGLTVRLWDDDVVTEANIGRQCFAESEVGLPKAVALINRVNRWAGTNWKAEARRFQHSNLDELPEEGRSMIYLSCVDNVDARFDIAGIISQYGKHYHHRNAPRYWMDFGNGRRSGQVILSTVGELKQPKSKQYETVGNLPFITDEFGELLRESEATDDTPSCSVAEALGKQDLFINSAVATLGCELLWDLFRKGMTPYRGFFLNLTDFRTQPLSVARE